MSLFFTQGHKGICSKNRLIPGPTGPRGPPGPQEVSYEKIILECKSGETNIESTPLQSLKIGPSYIFLKSPSTLIFKEVPIQFSVLFKSNFKESFLSFSLFDTQTKTMYDLLENKVEPNLFVFVFSEITPEVEYILHVNGSAI
jgi:hypothetical protein